MTLWLFIMLRCAVFVSVCMSVCGMIFMRVCRIVSTVSRRSDSFIRKDLCCTVHLFISNKVSNVFFSIFFSLFVMNNCYRKVKKEKKEGNKVTCIPFSFPLQNHTKAFFLPFHSPRMTSKTRSTGCSFPLFSPVAMKNKTLYLKLILALLQYYLWCWP